MLRGDCTALCRYRARPPRTRPAAGTHRHSAASVRGVQGAIDYDEFKHVLHLKANLAFDDTILAALMKQYDDDGSGVIDFR